MKKLSTLLHLLVLFTLLAGCTGTPQVTPSPALPTATAAPQTSPTPKNTDLQGLLNQGTKLAPVVVQSMVTKTGGGAIEVQFDQPMDPNTTSAALKISAPDGKQVPGKVTWPDAALLRFTPDQALQPGSTYQVRLLEQATSSGGVALKDALRLAVSTADTLRVAQVFPADGTEGVATDSAITVMFTRPVVPLRIAEEQKDLPQPLQIDPPLEGSGEWVNTSVYIYHPAQPLRGSQTYRLTIAAGLADVSGASAPLPEAFAWSFTSMPPAIDWLKIHLDDERSVAFGEEGSSNNVSLNPEFSMRFFQPMDRSSTGAALSLVPSGGGPDAPLTLTWGEENRSLDVTPTNPLALDTPYLLKITTDALSTSGSPLGKEQSWSFRTVPAPSVKRTTPADGSSKANPYFEISFASQMKLDTLEERVVFDPPLGKEKSFWYDSYENRLTFYGLASSTRYTVRLLPGMADLYGNTIQAEQVIRFTTRAQDPQAWLLMPYMPQVRAGKDEVFYTRLVNVPSATFWLYKLTQEEGKQMLGDRRYDSFPRPQNLVWQQDYRPESVLDQPNLASLPLNGPGGAALEKGFYLLAMDAQGVDHPNTPYVDTRFITVADANLMLKTGPTEALAWVTGLDNGAPMDGVRVTLYNQHFDAVGEGSTGPDGLVRLDLPDPSPDMQWVRAVVDDGAHFAFADGNDGAGVSPSDYGIWEQYYEAPRPDVTYLYTDRPIYRPGQPVYFKGILRRDDDLQYSLPDKSEVEVTILSYDEKVHNEVLKVSDWGTFNGTFTLDPEAELGTYSLEVKYPGAKENIGAVVFNVAEYRRPEFQVKLEVAPSVVLAGEDFSVNLKADYYAGGGVSNADVAWSLRSASFTFTPPPEAGRYSFTDFDYDAYYDNDSRRPGQPADNLLAEGTGVTDDQGRLTLTLPADLKTDASQRLLLEVTVTDFAGTSVSGQAAVVAHRSAVYPGIRFDGYIGEVGKEQRIELIALDWAGDAAAGQTVDVQVVERRWHSVQEQDERGNLKWTSSVEEIPVTEFSGVTLDGEGKGSVAFTPPSGGVYKARVTARDGKGNPAVASSMIWVTGGDFIPWRQTNNRSFQIVTDKTEYQPGETAEVLIASPFQGPAYALLTLERGRIRKQEVFRLESNSTVYRLPITGDMAPNVYLSVMVIKGVDENNPRPNFKVGMTEIKVATDQQLLKLDVQADPPSAGPGQQVTYTVRAAALDGQPVEAEVSLGLSDLATLSLAPSNTVPIETGFYDRRGLRVRTSMAMINSAEDYNAAIDEHLSAIGRGMGSGGKGEGELGVIEVRQDFPDTAFWQADIRTDSGGTAQVTVRLPDNLTTWRMDARAVTLDTRVGQVTSDLVSSKPLLLRPQTPRFFVDNDQATLGAAVHNNTTMDLRATVQLEGTGITIDGNAAQQVEIPAGQRVYVTWQVRVQPGAEKVDLTFLASGTGANGEAYTDASKPTIGSAGQEGLPVYRYEAPETVSTSGQLTERGALTESILLPQTMDVTQAELSVSVAPSLSASLTDGLTYLEHYPYECTEQLISRFLPNVLVTRVLREAGLSDPDLEAKLKEQVGQAIQRLASRQRTDGGWTWWDTGPSNEQISAYVVLGLLEARDAGYDVPDRLLQDGLYYVHSNLSLTGAKYLDAAGKANRQAFMLSVLARAGRSDAALTQRLFDDRLKLNLDARALLMRAIALLDINDPRLKTLAADFSGAAVVSASGAHWEEPQTDRWNWSSDTRTTAIVLGTLVKTDPLNPQVANAVRWLMSHRREGRWGSTQETAWTLIALADWMRASGELKGNYPYAVGLNGQPIAEGQVDPGNIRQAQTMRVDIASLLKDEANQLVVAHGAGQGSLYYTADLKVWLPVPQIEPLDRGIVLSREYYRLDDPETPVTGAGQGELLRGRLTIIAPKALHYVVIDDPLPAGLEGVDTSLLTSPQGEQPEAIRWDDINETGWGWWYFDHLEMRDEKLVFSADYLPAGTYVFTYLVRASTPGVYNVIPPTGQEFYFPEVYGRGAGGAFEVK